MAYPDAAWGRAMTVQEVVLKALSGEIHWFRAADLLGMSARTLRRWRELRACFGELLHIDGSRHAWFALAPDQRATLVAIPDDATNRVVYAQLWEGESTRAVMTALGEVFRTYGLPMALYSDRAGWAFYTPTAKGPVDKKQVTQVGRALAMLGVEHIPAYSPQARSWRVAGPSSRSGTGTESPPVCRSGWRGSRRSLLPLLRGQPQAGRDRAALPVGGGEAPGRSALRLGARPGAGRKRCGPAALP
jgi:hypothetical protein